MPLIKEAILYKMSNNQENTNSKMGQKVSLKDAFIHAAKLATEGKLGQAEKICTDIIAANDKFHQAYHLLGQIALKARKAEVAAQMTHKAILVDDSVGVYHRDLAEILCLGGKPKDAMVVIERALKLNLNDPKSHYIAGMSLSALGMRPKSIDAYKKAVELNPKYGLAYNNLGSALENSGNMDSAKAAYAKAVEINENHAEAQNNLAAILLAEGDVDGATKHFEAGIKARPNFIDPHYNLSTIKKYTDDDIHIKQMETIAQNTSSLPMDARIRLCFALGKAYEDAGKYEQAFDMYSAANKAKRDTFQFNEDRAIETVEKIKTTFDKPYLKGAKKSKKDDPVPIFVVGMPRSGSTLIEQILCSHSEVHGAGEVSFLTQAIQKKCSKFPEGISELSDADLAAIGKEYLAQLKALAPDAKRIVDKMPANFHYSGLIAKILPGAHIINTERHPLDSCLSNYARLFNQTMEFAYNLEELGRYYNRYQDLIKHWHAVLPKKTLLDVHYEEVVADTEKQARALLDFVGLEWQKSCLEFYKNKRTVHTASVAQVRQPIYKSSVKRWEKFGNALDPLKKIVCPELK